MIRETLALEGGSKACTRPIPSTWWGASVIGEEELALVTEVIRSRSLFRDYGPGKPHMVNDFEREARAYFGAAHALAVTSGSAALYCAMAGLGIGPGDEVILPALVWRSDFQAPVALGATPVFADIDRSLNLDPADLERKITPRTKAVIMVYFQGGVGDVGCVLEVCSRRNLKLVEDCAQSVGATYRGQKLGSFGDVGCFSFQHNKIMVTGEGGLVVARDPRVFERAVRYHDLGLYRSALQAQTGQPPAVADFSGLQFRMNELTGAVALAQLRKLDRAVLDITRRHFRWLKTEVQQTCPGLGFRATGDDDGDAGINLFLDLGSPERGLWFNRALAAEGVPVGATTRACNALAEEWVLERRQTHPAAAPFGPGCPGEARRYPRDACPQTDGIIASMVAIPITPHTTEQDLRDVADAIAKVWRLRSPALFALV
jgi:8-amino-3,8-dideoxy-alpha-D-manno-octulosonate transaminase